MKSEKLKVKTAFYRRSFCRLIGYLAFGFSLFTIHFSLSTHVAAQDGPADLAPPPLRTVTKQEKAQLNEVSDLKIHTKLALELMNSRLSQAEHLTSTADFDGVFNQLGGFHGLLDNTLNFLGTQDSKNGKVLDNYKRLEIGLRAFGPRLEAIRRELPLRYEDYVHKLLQYVRDSRAKAVEPMFGDSVVPTGKHGFL